MTFFQKNINFLTKTTGTSQEVLADCLGMRHSAVSSWKNGKSKPRPDKIDKIADYFNISPLDLQYTDLTADNEMTIHISATKNSNPNVQIGNTVRDGGVEYNVDRSGKKNEIILIDHEKIILKERVAFLEGQVQILRELLGK
jgi:transcriptional regulator with XRE-family HTH domain